LIRRHLGFQAGDAILQGGLSQFLQTGIQGVWVPGYVWKQS
jgi:hypothetical protein